MFFVDSQTEIRSNVRVQHNPIPYFWRPASVVIYLDFRAPQPERIIDRILDCKSILQHVDQSVVYLLVNSENQQLAYVYRKQQIITVGNTNGAAQTCSWFLIEYSESSGGLYGNISMLFSLCAGCVDVAADVSCSSELSSSLLLA